MDTEYLKCNACGEEWDDTSEVICPSCNSDDTMLAHYDDEDALLPTT